MTDTVKLKRCLDTLAAEYGTCFLDSDPVSVVHEYPEPQDREIAGFVVSVLAYGGAGQIKTSARAVLGRAGKSPSEFVLGLTPGRALSAFRSFRHRWTGGGDMAFVFWILGNIIGEYGSIGALVRNLDTPSDPTIGGVMSRFSEWITARYSSRFRTGSSRQNISYLIPSPSNGSACKRLAMYFRWMVRGPDGVDFGLWRFISPSRLVIPVDRHIARMAVCLGLTGRSSPDWNMALEITEALRRLDPDDPVRYDFALVRPGILRKCAPPKTGDCLSCLLREVCREAS